MNPNIINIYGTADDLLDWMQEIGAQVWPNKDGTWTCFVKGKAGECRQPTKPTLREALIAAKNHKSTTS